MTTQKSFLCLTLFFWGVLTLYAQQSIPAGYTLVYEQDFESETALSDFFMTDKTAWKLNREGGNASLELFGASEYEPAVRSPRNIACIDGLQLKDFVLEVQLAQTGRDYGHRDMCLFFNMKDPANFYYVHIATAADPHAHNIFLVNDEPRVAIAEKTTEGADWGEQGSWHTVRIVRESSSGRIQVFFDDLETPIMETHDTHFGKGYIGFGSFDDTGKIDNIKIWAPENTDAPAAGFFPNGK